MENKIRFLLADDHSMIRQGLAFVIEDLNINSEVIQVATLDQTIDTIKTTDIDVLILDAQFPEGMSWTILKEIKNIQPDIKILIFTGLDENSYALKYMKAGADGFLTKLSDEEEMKFALEEFLDKGEYISEITKKNLIESFKNPAIADPLSLLTERELQIAKLYANGLGNLEIANQLEVKQNTVSTMKKRIFDKLNIENLVELIEMLRLNT